MTGEAITPLSYPSYKNQTNVRLLSESTGLFPGSVLFDALGVLHCKMTNVVPSFLVLPPVFLFGKLLVGCFFWLVGVEAFLLR